MTLIEKLRTDRIQAMKDKDTIKRNILGLVVSNSQLLAKESKEDNPSDTHVVSVIKSLIKGNRELLEKAPDNQNEKIEIEILENYLPKQMDDEEIFYIIKKFVESIPGDQRGPRAIGLVMKHLSLVCLGRFDGKRASFIAKELL